MKEIVQWNEFIQWFAILCIGGVVVVMALSVIELHKRVLKLMKKEDISSGEKDGG